MLTRITLLVASLFVCFSCFSQGSESYTLSGYVSDLSSGERLIGASVYQESTGKGTSSNVYGFYSLTLPKGEVQIVFSYVGYKPIKLKVQLTEDIKQDVGLDPSVELEEAVITATEKIEQRTQMSTVTLDMKKIEQLPVLLGEKDLLKIIQLLPGVQSGSEGSSGLYVRGGGPDQNLMLLDGVPIYNASHLFGFFSVFNADAIRNVELVKGGFPARYGGRLSSVLDIRMNEGNMQEFHGSGSIGLISSKLTLEGPIKTDRTSFIVSARRTYIDVLAQPFIRAQDPNFTSGYYFYDLNAKINHVVDDNNRVYLSGYFGRDKAYVREKSTFGEVTNKFDSKLAWGNAIVAARWNHLFGPKLFSNTTLTYSKYGFLISAEEETVSNTGTEAFKIDYDSGIRDLGAKVDFDFIPNPDHYVKFGGSYIYHKFTPGVNSLSFQDGNTALDTTFGSNVVWAHESFVYAEDDWQIGSRLKINPGVHLSHFNVNNKNYFGLQPRIGLRYLARENLSLKVSYAKMYQYLHLLSNAGIGLPTDLWVPVTDRILPQTSDQVAAGFASTISNNFELSVEGYYKRMQNLIEYSDGAAFQGNAEDWQNKVTPGNGTSYGAEVLLSKQKGDFTGWIGYTLSWSIREFEELNFGEPFPYRYDRRHDVGVALSYQINDRIDVGAVWVYGTGNAVSLPLARYQGSSLIPSMSGNGEFNFGGEVEYFPERNNYRMPAYHRFDIGINFKKQMAKHERIWNFSIYNLYNRQNPFFLDFEQEYNELDMSSKTKLFQYSLFPLLPSFSYAFKF